MNPPIEAARDRIPCRGPLDVCTVRIMGDRIDTFTNDDLTFDVTDEGPLDGTPVVLLHGWPQTARSWTRVAPHLHERGYRTIAPNQRGYSPGARPRGRFAYRMSALVGDTAALLDAVGQPVHLVGHDWGAAVAWSTAAAHPESVRTLTSVSVPHPMAFVRSLVRSSQAIRSYYMAFFQLPWIPEAVATRPDFARRALRSSGMDDEQIADVLRDVIDSGAMPYSLNWYRAMYLGNPRDATQQVVAPTTHVWSTRDTALVRKGAELTADYVAADFTLEVLDATHWIPEEKPAELADIIAARVESVGTRT